MARPQIRRLLDMSQEAVIQGAASDWIQGVVADHLEVERSRTVLEKRFQIEDISMASLFCH